MARLFITPREVDFIGDITKEIIKDVIGQKIYYYPISSKKTKIHDVYEESPEKVFDNPIEINCLVQFQETMVTTGKFGAEDLYNIEVFVQDRDMIDKEIQLYQGDFFSYGPIFFEVTQVIIINNIYGEREYVSGIKLMGREARKGQFVSDKVFGPTSEKYSDADATQKTFIQQRGFAENAEGPTGDVRTLQKLGVVTKPISGPAEVSPKGGTESASAFYDES